MGTIWVQATRDDRKVIVSEYDPSHPTPNHEIWVVGYPDRTADDGTFVQGNPPIEVGDTALVRQRIAAGDLKEVSAPGRTERAAKADQPKPGA